MSDIERNADANEEPKVLTKDVKVEGYFEATETISEVRLGEDCNHAQDAENEAQNPPISRYEDESPWAYEEARAGFDSDDDEFGCDPGSDHRNDPSWNINLGKRGEEAAVRFLNRKGFDVIERNWTCDLGEIDIIAEDETSIHFIEVKTRSSVDKGFPAEAVNARKRRKYEMMAMIYLTNYDRVDVSVCFDIISIVVTADERAMLRFHSNAFTCDVM